MNVNGSLQSKFFQSDNKNDHQGITPYANQKQWPKPYVNRKILTDVIFRSGDTDDHHISTGKNFLEL